MHANPNIDYELVQFSNNPPQTRKWMCNVKGCRRRFKNKRHWEQHFVATHLIERKEDDS